MFDRVLNASLKSFRNAQRNVLKVSLRFFDDIFRDIAECGGKLRTELSSSSNLLWKPVGGISLHANEI